MIFRLSALVVATGLVALLLTECSQKSAAIVTSADASAPRVKHQRPRPERFENRKKCVRDSDCPEHYACACRESAECTYTAVYYEEPGQSGENVCEWLADDEDLPPDVVEWRRHRDAGMPQQLKAP